MAIKRLQITFSDEVRGWLQENYRDNGHASLSKFVNSIVTEYIQKRTAPPEPEGPLTPEQELDKVMETIGQLNSDYDKEFTVMRSLVPEDLRNVPFVTIEDVQKRIAAIKLKLRENNGFGRLKGRVIPISTDDLKQYETLFKLLLRKKELERIVSGNIQQVS